MRGAGVALRSACTGADFQTDSVTTAIACGAAPHRWSASRSGESPATAHASAAALVMNALEGTGPLRTDVAHNRAASPSAKIKRRTTPF